MIESKKINNSININNIKLSEGAINFLDNQMVKNGDIKLIETNFIFQVIHAIKKLPNWYCCSLLDKNTKFGGFCIKYANQYGIPKKGDIIQTNKIQIVKLPNRDTNLYFCEDVKKLNESKKMIIDPKKLDSITKKRSSSKKNSNLNYKLLGNINNNKNIFNSSQKSLSTNLNNNVEQNKYTLISNLDNFTNNPIFFLKCRTKSVIKEYIYKSNNRPGFVQNYMFFDTNGDEIQGVAFDKYANDYNEIIKVGSVYEIYKAERKQLNPNFQKTKCQIGLTFRNYTMIKELEDKGEFDNFKKSKFIEIGELTIDNINRIINVRGIVLEDRGITEKKKENDKSMLIRRLLIGDKSLHKINIKLYGEKVQPDKNYIKGEIITVFYIKYMNYNNYYYLSSNPCTEIVPCDNPENEKELKDFYIKHPYIYEYKDMNYVGMNSKSNVKFQFVNDIIDEYNKEYNENDKNNQKLIKINGTVKNFNHKVSNYFECCAFCNKKTEEVCPNCLTDKKKLILKFDIEITDCSGNLWIELYGEIAEHFIGISADEYEKLIKNNDKTGLNNINKRIIYHNYSFIGKYRGPGYDEDHYNSFAVLQFNENDKDYFKELINKLKPSIEK